MFPKTHIILGFIFSSIVLILFPRIEWFGFAVIFASSVLIDVDHYLFYAFTKKDLSLKNAYKWFVNETKKLQKLSIKEKKQAKSIVCIFHGIELIILLLILIYFSFYKQFFTYILIGILFHELLDFVNIVLNDFKLSQIGSQTFNLIQYNKNSNKTYF